MLGLILIWISNKYEFNIINENIVYLPFPYLLNLYLIHVYLPSLSIFNSLVDHFYF